MSDAQHERIVELEDAASARERHIYALDARIAELEARIVELEAELETEKWSDNSRNIEAQKIGGEFVRLQAARIAELEAEIAGLKAKYMPGMTDLMVPPETLDAWLDDNPLPEEKSCDEDTDELIGEPSDRERLAQILDTEADWMTSNPEKARQFRAAAAELRAIPPDREHEITLWWNNPWGHWVISYEGRDWFRPTLEDAVSLIKETALHSDVPNAAKLLRSPAP